MTTDAMTTDAMTTDAMTTGLLWPDYATPADLTAIEAVPLQARGLPETTYALLTRAATLWPDRVAVSVAARRGPLAGAAATHLRRAPRRRPPLRRTCCTSSACDAATRSP